MTNHKWTYPVAGVITETITIIITTDRSPTANMALKLVFLGALIAFLSAFRSAGADDVCDPAPTGRALDVEFDAAVESFVAQAAPAAIPEPYGSLIERLDSDSYKERAEAGGRLLADSAAGRWLLRARAVERRPEVRYWLNRTLRQLDRCDHCDGLGYCAKYDPAKADLAIYQSEPCRRCGRNEWQHGGQWVADGIYRPLACAACGGSGTYWNHYAVD